MFCFNQSFILSPIQSPNTNQTQLFDNSFYLTIREKSSSSCSLELIQGCFDLVLLSGGLLGGSSLPTPLLIPWLSTTATTSSWLSTPATSSWLFTPPPPLGCPPCHLLLSGGYHHFLHHVCDTFYKTA